MSQEYGLVRDRYIAAFGEKDGANIYRIYEDLYFSWTNWQRWDVLFSEEQGNLDVLNSAAPTFFYLVRRMMIERFVTSLVRLTEKRKAGGNTNGSLEYYLELAIDENDMLKQELQGSIIELRGEIKDFKDWRNKKYAHFDADDVVPSSKRTLDMLTLKELFGKASAIFERIESHHFVHTVRTTMAIRRSPDVEHLVHLVKLGLEEHKARFGHKPKS